jgi:predicted SpoU family rRNA methylase
MSLVAEHEYAEVVESFMEIAKEHGGPFSVEPVTRDENPHIGVWLKDGTDIPALAIFGDDLGNWTMVRASDGMVAQYLSDEVL